MRLYRPHAVLGLSLACFAALAAAVVLAGDLPFDRAVRDALLEAGPAATAVMRVANWGGEARLLVPATLLLAIVVPRARQRWWLWLGLMVTAPLAEGALKLLVLRPRPEGSGLAFPSGHATAAAAFFGAVFYLAGALSPGPRRALRALALAAIALVAAARVVLRAHWPSDVLAGVALGLALAAAAALLDGRLAPSARPGPT